MQSWTPKSKGLAQTRCPFLVRKLGSKAEKNYKLRGFRKRGWDAQSSLTLGSVQPLLLFLCCRGAGYLLSETQPYDCLSESWESPQAAFLLFSPSVSSLPFHWGHLILMPCLLWPGTIQRVSGTFLDTPSVRSSLPKTWLVSLVLT